MQVAKLKELLASADQTHLFSVVMWIGPLRRREWNAMSPHSGQPTRWNSKRGNLKITEDLDFSDELRSEFKVVLFHRLSQKSDNLFQEINSKH